MSNFASDMDKFAYAIGINMGEYVEQMAVKMDGKMVAAGLADYLAGASKLDPKEYQEAMQKLQELMRAAGEKELAAVSEANRAAEAKFMEENGVARFPDAPTERGVKHIRPGAQRGDGAHIPIPQPGACQPRARHHPRHLGRQRPRGQNVAAIFIIRANASAS